MEVNHQKFILFKISFEYERYAINNALYPNHDLYFNLEKKVWDLVKIVIYIDFLLFASATAALQLHERKSVVLVIYRYEFSMVYRVCVSVCVHDTRRHL